MAASICSALNPMRPNSTWAPATCDAVNDVVRPSSLACSLSRSNSLPVAPVIAFTADMVSEKFA